jgi:serine/threonine protein kinase
VLTKLGKYEIKRELGRGAMGVVYEGFDPFIERTVAIKTIQKSLIDQSEAQEALSRFRREAQAAGRLTHPNIVSVYEYGEEGDMAFIAMELIIGKELKEYFDKAERFQIKDCVHIMQQLLDALDYSHERGVVHRDIKPSNIIITKGNQIKVVDFGIARIESSELTQVGMVLGTPAYMSPEQFRCLVADCRSDIYSAGVILYQFLTGARPFTGNPTNLMHKVLCQAPVPPSELNPEVSKALDDVVKKAMSKQPEERFQTAAEFKQALNLAIGSAAISSAQTMDTDATLAIAGMPRNAQADDNIPIPVIDFDLEALRTNIEKHLEEVRLSASLETTNSALSEFESELIVVPVMAQPVSSPQSALEGANESSLLAGLAHEAKGKAEAQQSVPQATEQPIEHQAKDLRLHETLGRIAKFLDLLAQQVKKVGPPIKRSYTFGRLALFTNLTCRTAHSDSRRQYLSESALLDYVFLSVILCAPAPVVISRPRDMFGRLKEQLNKLKLRPLDDLDALSKGPQEDWVQVRLAPDFPMHVQFKANYEEGYIDVHALNIETFGPVSFKLKVEDVTPELLDGIGLFLLDRTDKLPEVLRRV